jgi:hypothetical protein
VICFQNAHIVPVHHGRASHGVRLRLRDMGVDTRAARVHAPAAVRGDVQGGAVQCECSLTHSLKRPAFTLLNLYKVISWFQGFAFIKFNSYHATTRAPPCSGSTPCRSSCGRRESYRRSSRQGFIFHDVYLFFYKRPQQNTFNQLMTASMVHVQVTNLRPGASHA